MESEIPTAGLLGQIPFPAFVAKKQKICQVNAEAAQLQLEPGQELAPLLHCNLQAYNAFQDGSMYMAMIIADRSFGVTVTREQDVDLFVIDSETPIRLQALALAAKELRRPFSEMFFASERIRQSNALQADIQAAYTKNTLRMRRALANMADASAFSKGEGMHSTTTDLSKVFRETYEKTAALIGEQGPKLSYSGPSQPVITIADPQLLQRAAYNLLSNAIKFTPKSGTVDVQVTQHSNMLQFTVQDGGVGVAPAVQGSFFTRYQRAPGIEEGRQGMGLGMLIVRSIALMHDGTVLLQQSPDRGAKVSFTVALRTVPAGQLFSHPLMVGYAGGKDPALLELSDALPLSAFE